MDRWRPARRDDGFTLMEVVVAMALFGVLSTVVLAAVGGASTLTRTNEHRVTAASLASRVLEAALVADPTTLPGPTSTDPGWTADTTGVFTKTVTTGNVPYVVRRSVAYVSQTGARGRCGVDKPSRRVAQQVLVSVDWPGRSAGVAPVTTSSVRTVDLNAVAPNSGTLYAIVEDRAGNAPGANSVTVQISLGGTVIATQTVGAPMPTGELVDPRCAVFPSLTPSGDYTITLSSSANYVDPQNLTSPSRPYVAVTRGTVTEEYFSYSSPDAPPAPPSALTVTGSCTGLVSPTLRNSSQSAANLGTTLTIAQPSGTVAGDLLVAFVSTNAPTAPATAAAAGWTIAQTTLGANNNKVAARVWWRWAAVNDPTSWSFTGTTGGLAGGIAAYRGVDGTAPVATSTGAQDGSGASSIGTPTLTSVSAGTVLLGMFTQSSGSGSWTPPSGMTELVDVANLAGGVQVEMAAQSMTTGANSVARTATSTSNGKGIGQLVVLNGKPSAVATLSWTASPTPYADGYRLSRIAAGAIEQTMTVLGRSTSSAIDSGPLVSGATYTYDLATTAGPTVSASTQATFVAPTC